MCKKDDVGDIIRIFELDNYTLVKGLSFSTFSVSLKNWILNGGKLMQVKTESFGNVVMCVQKTIIQKVFLDWYNTYPLRMRRCILTWEPSLVSFSLIVVFEKNETENWNIIFGEWSGCIIICLSLIAKAEVGFGCSNSSYLRSYFHSIRDIFFFSWSFSSNLDTPWVHFLNLTLASLLQRPVN